MVVILAFKTNTLKNCHGRNKYCTSTDVSREICACFLCLFLLSGKG